MTCLDFLLGLEGPELDTSWAYDDIVSDWVISQGAQNILRTVRHAVYDGLDAIVVFVIPNFNHFVRAKTNEVISFFINVEIGNWSVMAVKLVKLLKSVRLPEDDMTFFSTTCNLFVLNWVDKAVNAFLVKVKSSFWDIGQSSQLVHMDKAIQWWGKKPIQVLIILNLGDPTPMGMHLRSSEAVLLALVQSRPLIFSRFTLLLGLGLLRILLSLHFFNFVLIHGSTSWGSLRSPCNCSSARVIIIVFILVAEKCVKLVVNDLGLT